jgi:hypothetical protein
MHYDVSDTFSNNHLAHHHHHSHHHYSLLTTIQHCEATCEHMITHLVQQRHHDSRDMQIQLLRDCADICTLMAKCLARESINSKVIAETCAYICQLCGTECSKFPDMMSQTCAHTCLNCAKECKSYSSM